MPVDRNKPQYMRNQRPLKWFSRYPSKAAVLDWDLSNHKHFRRRWNFSKNVEAIRRMSRKFDRPGKDYLFFYNQTLIV